MPVFNYDNRVQIKNAQGQKVDIDPVRFLREFGPGMIVGIGPNQTLQRTLNERNQSVPGTITGRALIDTGATFTAIDDETATQLHLPVVDETFISTPSSDGHRTKLYSQAIITITGTALSFEGARLIGASLRNQGIQILLGRDFLSMGILIYNGKNGSISFAM